MELEGTLESFPLAHCIVKVFLMPALALDLPRLSLILFFGSTARGILVPQPGIKPVQPALEAQSVNHWTARKAPRLNLKPALISL